MEENPEIRKSIENGWHSYTLDQGMHGGAKKGKTNDKGNKGNLLLF